MRSRALFLVATFVVSLLTGPASMARGAAAAEIDLVLELRAGDDLQRAFRDAGLPPKHPHRLLPASGLVTLSVPGIAADGILRALERSPAVATVSLDQPMAAAYTPNDPIFSAQWGSHLIGLPQLWDRTVGSSSVVVAVLDTGVSEHVDLQGALMSGYNSLNGTSVTLDDSTDQHGTAVAGVIAARGDNGLGMAGVCWKCRVLPVKVLDANGKGTTSTVVEGIHYAVDAGADAINLSLGGPDNQKILEDAVLRARDAGVVVVAAAGNDVYEPTYPAAYTTVLGVAATDETDRLYDWSNRGSWVTLAAPGCNPATWGAAYYVNFCGTSSAAPLVSGIAALLLATGKGPQTTTHLLTRTAKPSGSSAAKWGRADAGRIGTWLTPGTPLAGDWDGDGDVTGGWFRDGRFTLLNNNTSSPGRWQFNYGRRGDIPVVGDWNADGKDTVGIIRDGKWHLTNRHGSGTSDITFTYGRVGSRGDDVPLVGDWNGDGRDDIGIVRDGEWHLRKKLSGGPGQIVFTYGRVGPRGDDVPLVGDWNGDRRDTVGIVRDGEWHLRKSLSGGPGQIVFTYGRVTKGDTPLVGDWDGDGDDGAAVVRRWTWHLRNELSKGPAQISFSNGG